MGEGVKPHIHMYIARACGEEGGSGWRAGLSLPYNPQDAQLPTYSAAEAYILCGRGQPAAAYILCGRGEQRLARGRGAEMGA